MEMYKIQKTNIVLIRLFLGCQRISDDIIVINQEGAFPKLKPPLTLIGYRPNRSGLIVQFKVHIPS